MSKYKIWLPKGYLYWCGTKIFILVVTFLFLWILNFHPKKNIINLYPKNKNSNNRKCCNNCYCNCHSKNLKNSVIVENSQRDIDGNSLKNRLQLRKTKRRFSYKYIHILISICHTMLSNQHSNSRTIAQLVLKYTNFYFSSKIYISFTKGTHCFLKHL